MIATLALQYRTPNQGSFNPVPGRGQFACDSCTRIQEVGVGVARFRCESCCYDPDE